jgi:2,3-bisphosphoglycerate-dependent phosphoglycerate mutase
MNKTSPLSASQALMFVRHGATEPNLAGLRCGGDLDVPLSAQGRTQAQTAAQQMRAMGWPLGVIVSSDLRRTRETAHIIKGVFPNVELIIAPGFAERHLGEWNLMPISETDAALSAGATPPGGESRAEFFDRIAAAVDTLLPRLSQWNHPPLLVASKGVARVLGELLSGPVHRGTGTVIASAMPCANAANDPSENPSDRGAQNGELIRFDLARYTEQFAARCHA